MRYLILVLPIFLMGCWGIGSGSTPLDLPPELNPLSPESADLTGSLLTMIAPYSNMLFPGSGGLLMLAGGLHARRSSKKAMKAKEDHLNQDTGLDAFFTAILECNTVEEAKLLAKTARKMKI